MAALCPDDEFDDSAEDTHSEKNKGAHRTSELSIGPKHKWDLVKEKYEEQNGKHWPMSGRHILAHYDENSIVLYQAFKPSIAKFAVENQRFGGPHYSLDRMSWVKTNFMWMMYRCGWAQKIGQERVLAVRITLDGFENILSKAYTGEMQKSLGVAAKDLQVRLQWDPDHKPNGDSLPRRAIQLGLKGKILLDYGSKYILNIKDITEFVHEQYKVLTEGGQRMLCTPRERVYTPSREQTCRQLDISFHCEQTVVTFGS